MFLANLLGVRLVLWVGSVVPLPASSTMLDALESVEVTSDDTEGDGFQIVFRLCKTYLGEYDLLAEGNLEPYNRVIIGVIMGVVPQVLIDGIILHHEVTASEETGRSQLVVTGRDLSALMDQVEDISSYPFMPSDAIATIILAKYIPYGIIPEVSVTTDIPTPFVELPLQHGTDLATLRFLAQKCSYVFYVAPVTFGVSVAHFGIENRLSIPQSPLRVDMGPLSNVQSLNVQYKPSEAVSVVGSFYIPETTTTMDIPPLPTASRLPLSLLTDLAKQKKRLKNSAKMSPLEALMAAQAEQAKVPSTVSVSGTVDTIRYGSVLTCRQNISVCGAGLSYDGFYYVQSVQHNISRTSYTQSFRLTRDGRGPLSPVVPPE